MSPNRSGETRKDGDKGHEPKQYGAENSELAGIANLLGTEEVTEPIEVHVNGVGTAFEHTVPFHETVA